MSAGRRVFNKYRSDNTEVITDGYMSRKDAQDVLMSAFDVWGVNASSDEDIDPYLSRIAHVLRQGTSAERDYASVSFVYEGNRYSLDALALAAAKKDRTENPVRVFARSYNNGEIAARLHDMLKDPDNTIIRNQAALDYGVSLEYVHLSFDFADALAGYPGLTLSMAERYIIRNNTLNKVRSSRSMFIGGADGGSVQDSAAHATSVGAPHQPASVKPVAASSTRAQFSAVPPR